MGKVAFLPVSLGGGLLAGIVARKLFTLTWKVVDDQEPPEPGHREIHLGKLVLALILRGALSSLVKGLFDHGSRQLFTRLTGAWPGEEAPERA
jgi:hypothetical protein